MRCNDDNFDNTIFIYLPSNTIKTTKITIKLKNFDKIHGVFQIQIDVSIDLTVKSNLGHLYLANSTILSCVNYGAGVKQEIIYHCRGTLNKFTYISNTTPKFAFVLKKFQ